ncbi:hypothetical protein [Bacillus subtilis]|uniref:hypothetical protein n=1 Tax=Bacillus subtilis TaxID=1423 RepID=UPI00049ECAEB|nr:hypothetical protein [Bacillus subtilis]KDE23208.1 hypothetical protein EF83_13255 [Bacillus subtilis]QHQ81997.1 hypothetical protein GPJ55_20480 [Bacillus subtilis]
MSTPNFCPRCGGESVVQLITSTVWDVHKCSKCLASFANYDDGSDAREEAAELEKKERAELARLKAKYESEAEL